MTFWNSTTPSSTSWFDSSYSNASTELFLVLTVSTGIVTHSLVKRFPNFASSDPHSFTRSATNCSVATTDSKWACYAYSLGGWSSYWKIGYSVPCCFARSNFQSFESPKPHRFPLSSCKLCLGCMPVNVLNFGCLGPLRAGARTR